MPPVIQSATVPSSILCLEYLPRHAYLWSCPTKTQVHSLVLGLLNVGAAMVIHETIAALL
jgi:hypothetical protein